LLSEQIEIATAFKHAVELVIIDGVCLGIDVTENEKVSIVDDCNQYLDLLLKCFFDSSAHTEVGEYINTVAHIGVTPFVLPKVQNGFTQSGFAFEAKTTKRNLMKLLRAFTLDKPVLIEGPPGVGKTSLVENLAR
jgi:midasin (ATPase involved in ribosome maturation)